jgi:hypothetical protein
MYIRILQSSSTRKDLNGGYDMLLLIGIVLFVIWILGFTAFHVAGGLIHLLLVFAVISVIAHLIMGRRATV